MTIHPPPNDPAWLRRERARFDALKQALAQIDFFLRGNLVPVYTRCNTKGCRCMATPPRPHGPYVQWTRKVAGKTVSVRIKPQQLALMKHWISNSRRLDRLIADMQKISLRATGRILRHQAQANHQPAHGSRSRGS